MGISANIKLRSRPVITIISDLFTKQMDGVKRVKIFVCLASGLDPVGFCR